MKFIRKKALTNIQQIMDLLASKHLTRKQVAEEIGVSYDVARQYINKLYDDDVIHIKEYVPVESNNRIVMRPAYAAGRSVDAKRPIPVRKQSHRRLDLIKEKRNAY